MLLPKYLVPSQQKELFDGLKSFEEQPEKSNFYLSQDNLHDQLLQGDGWKGLVAINFFTLEKKSVSGMILSNSCDISSDNARSREASVVFSPIIRLSRLRSTLESAGRTASQIDNAFRSMRQQRTTSAFYLPSLPGVMEESVVFLDDLHAHPLNDFASVEKSRAFRLNQVAFYILLMKISIHFSRFQEGIARF